MTNDDENIQDSEGCRYHHKEVAGQDRLGVIPDKGHPALRVLFLVLL
jgi:hypothetical protein